MERFDAVVVGAGPAGSVAAYQLATAGASVLLLDRARFPRDKPCGGGLTGRALRQLPFAVDPVVEEAADRFELRLRFRNSFERRSVEPIVLLTQRIRLDAFLAEQAVAAGADFRDGVRVDSVEAGEHSVRVRADGRPVEAAVVLGADGANGTTAGSLGLGGDIGHGVALEANLPYGPASRERYRRRLVLELGTIPGGYGWVFPKGDHVNVGVGGWKAEGPRLRQHLRLLCEAHGLPFDRLEGLRGHRLPLRRPATRLARGRGALIGDAAGLVDPLSGDGMYEAFLSARLASEAALDVLAGRASGLDPYDAAVTAALARVTAAAWGIKVALDRFPRLTYAAVRVPLVWPVIEAIVRGDISSPGEARGPARGPIRVLKALARRAGDPGRAYLAA